MYYIERFDAEGWVQAGYGKQVDAVCKVGQELSESHKCVTRVKQGSCTTKSYSVAMYSHGDTVYDDR